MFKKGIQVKPTVNKKIPFFLVVVHCCEIYSENSNLAASGKRGRGGSLFVCVMFNLMETNKTIKRYFFVGL